MHFLSAVVFALAVSMDGLGVGISYGLRRIVLPWYSLLVICLTSSLAITCSMVFGQTIAGWLSPLVAERIGAVILIGVGIWLLVQNWAGSGRDSTPGERKKHVLFRFRVPGLGIAVQVLKEPMEADFDRSGVINFREALVLGFALAMDALGAGFGAAVAGLYLWYVPVLVGGFKLLLLTGGLVLSRLGTQKVLTGKIAVLPACILVFLGLIKI